MYAETLKTITDLAVAKVEHQKHFLTAHLAKSALAGMYIAAAIVLILLMIWWCMFMFITCSFEHSVANMSGLLMGLLLNDAHHANIAVLGYMYNLSLATFGNIIGGAMLVAGMYRLRSPRQSAATETTPLEVTRIAGPLLTNN